MNIKEFQVAAVNVGGYDPTEPLEYVAAMEESVEALGDHIEASVFDGHDIIKDRIKREIFHVVRNLCLICSAYDLDLETVLQEFLPQGE